MMIDAHEPRTRHYGGFYGLDDEHDDQHDDRPLWIVHGNCQAESVRVLLSGVVDAPYRTVRMPPVHELEQPDLPHLDRLLNIAAVVISQPVRAGYRAMPLGTDDIRSRTDATILRWPVIRYAGLYPYQAIVRHPSDPSASPPGVPYHDLRTIAAARDGVTIDDARLPPAGTPEALREVGMASVAELARRERRDTDVGVSDVLLGSGADAAHTINHPGNRVLIVLAERILNALEVARPVPEPGRALLGYIRAPLDEAVITALGLVDVPARTHWSLGGEPLSVDEVHREQLRWYATHPEFIGAALERHATTMRVLGLDG